MLSLAAAARAQVPLPVTALAVEEAVTRAAAFALDQRIIAESKAGSEIMVNLSYLSDVIGPRLTGSAALKRANDYTAEKMRGYGLSNVSLEGWTIPAGWERGPASMRIIEPDNGRSLHVAAMGWTPGTTGKIQGDVVVVTARSPAELAAYKGKLKDAIVLRGPPSTVRPINEPARAPGAPPAGPAGPGGTPGQQGFNRPERAFGGDFMQLRREMNEMLRTEGAAATISDAGKPHGLMTVSGSWGGRDRPSAGEPMPSLMMAHEHYALLHRLATRPAPARTRVEIDVQNKLIPGPIPVYNTIGEIRGSVKPNEFVVVGAHLDSWDLAQGTTDNGTGSCVVLEAARILARCGVQPKRTIRFALFTGEEQGLHGSRVYVQQHKDEMARTSVAVVHDTGTGRVNGIGLQGRPIIKPIFDTELIALKPLGFTDINARSMGGSDHQSFEGGGVPGFALQQDMTEYRLTHHSQTDTFDKAREADLVQGAQVMAVIAMRVANLPSLLPREKQGGGGRPAR